jgi:hypothetical protein
MLKPLAKLVVSVANGRAVSRGSVAEALQKDKTLSDEVKHELAAVEMDTIEEKKVDLEEGRKEGNLIEEEEIAQGRLSWKSRKFARYGQQSGSPMQA